MKSLKRFIIENFDFGNYTLYVPKSKQVDVETEMDDCDIYNRMCDSKGDTVIYRVNVTKNKQKDFNTIVNEYDLKFE